MPNLVVSSVIFTSSACPAVVWLASIQSNSVPVDDNTCPAVPKSPSLSWIPPYIETPTPVVMNFLLSSKYNSTDPFWLKMACFSWPPPFLKLIISACIFNIPFWSCITLPVTASVFKFIVSKNVDTPEVTTIPEAKVAIPMNVDIPLTYKFSTSRVSCDITVLISIWFA